MRMEAETENTVVEGGHYTITDVHQYAVKENKKKFRNITITSLDPLKEINLHPFSALTLNSGECAELTNRAGKKSEGLCVANITLTKKEFDFLHDEMNVREFFNVNLDASDPAEINAMSNNESIENLCSKIFENENKNQLDLTFIENEIGSDIEKQRKFISILLKRRDMARRIRKHGVLLPAFITAQSEAASSINDIKRLADLILILQEADTNLKKLSDQPQPKQKLKREKYLHGEKFQRIVSTASGRRVKNIILHPAGLSATQFTPAEFEYYVKAHHFKNFRNCTVTGSINLSMQKGSSKKLRTVRNFNMPTAPSINLCNTILIDGASSKGAVNELIFNDTTDFRRYDFARSELKDDANLTYVGKNGVSVTLTVSAFLKSFEEKYYQLRGSKKNNLRTDFLAELSKKSNSEKVMLILKHMQAQQNRLIKFARGHRTLDTFNAIVGTFLKQKKEMIAIEAKRNVETSVSPVPVMVSERSSEEMMLTIDAANNDYVATKNNEEIAENNILNFLKEYDAAGDEQKIDLLTSAKSSYLFLQSVNPQKAQACLLEISKGVPLLNHTAFVFCLAVDYDRISKFVSKQKKILERFSHFEAFIGSDVEKNEISEARREKNKNKIVFACQFLQLNGEEKSVAEFKYQLKKISYRYFNYAVINSCRGCDENNNQIYFLDHNTPEELFILLNVVSDAAELEKKSDHRDDCRTKQAAFFTMPRKNVTPKEEYERLCGEQWLRTPLETLIDAGCFQCDGKIIKDELFSEAAASAQAIISKKAIVNQLREKQILIAELIKRGKYQAANDILVACHREWPGMSLDVSILDAITYLKNQAQEEVRLLADCKGIAFKKMSEFKNSMLFKNNLIGNQTAIQDLIEFEKTVMKSVLLSKTIIEIAGVWSLSPEKRIEHKNLQDLEKVASCRNLELFVDDATVSSWIFALERVVSCAVLGESKCGVIQTILTLLKEAQDKKTLNEMYQLQNIIRTAYQFDKALRLVRDALSNIWEYSEIQWSMLRDGETDHSVGMLMKVRGPGAIPEINKAYGFNKKEKLIEVDGVTMNVNYFKYLCAYDIQEKLIEFRCCVPTDLSSQFISMRNKLEKIQQQLNQASEGGGKFARCIAQALENVIAAEQNWRSDVSKTIYDFRQSTCEMNGAAILS